MKKSKTDKKKPLYIQKAEDLRYAIDVLDGFRRPPFPYRKLEREQVKKARKLKPMERTKLHVIIENIKDPEISKKWEILKNHLIKFLAVYREYEHFARNTNIKIFGIVALSSVILSILAVTRSLPLWIVEAIVIPIFIILILTYRHYEMKRIQTLRKKWKHGHLVRELVDTIAAHLSKLIKQHSLNPSDYKITSNFNDYKNLRTVTIHKNWFELEPKT